MHHPHPTRPLPWAARAGAATVAALGVTALLPAGAAAATVKGAVIARDVHRGTVVTADASGHVSTLRVSRAGRARVGRVVRAVAVQLADGSYRVSKLSVAGRARHEKVRATVVRRTSGGYLVSAGGSTFALHLRRAATTRAVAASTDPALQPGDEIVATTDTTGSSLATSTVQVTGSSSVVELEGIVVSVSADQLQLAAEHQGLVNVAIPAGTTVQAAPGDEIQVMASVAADGSFTLVTAAADGQSDGHDGGFQVDGEHGGEVEVHGQITAIAPDSVTVQAGQDPAVTCAVPAGTDVSAFAVGDQVELHCFGTPSGLTLRELHSDTAEVQAPDQSGDGQDQSGDGQDQSSGDAQQSGGDTQQSGGDTQSSTDN